MKFHAKSFSITVLTAMIFTVVLSGRAFATTEVSENKAGGRFSVQIEGEEKPVGGWSPVEITYIEEEQPEEPEIRFYRNTVNGAVDDVFINGASDVGYNSLSKDSQRALYRDLDRQVQEFMSSETDLERTNGEYEVASIPYYNSNLSADEGIQVFFAYDYDHPGYYWISNSISVTNYNVKMLTEPEYASVSARSTINSKIINGVKEYAAIAEKGENTLDRIAIIHDLIVNDVDYAYNNGRPESSKWAHSLQGVFDEHKEVVCEGYADTFSLMMNYMNIPNYYIVGTAGEGGAGGGGGHAWNAVYVDSLRKYLYMDLTWDDLGDGEYSYHYFGMPKTDFETNHTKYVPQNSGIYWLYALNGTFADSFEDTYYYRGGFYCDSDNYADFANRINTKIHRFGTMVSFLAASDTVAAEVNYCLTGAFSCSAVPASYKNVDYYIVINKNMTEDVDLSQAQVTLTGDVYAYTGSSIEPKVEKVVCNGIKLIEGLNYTVSYEDNIDAGDNTAKVKVTGSTRFSGTAVKTFSISDDAISGSMVTLSASEFEYNGSSRKPTVTVIKDGSTLRENTDYSVSYSDDTVNAGTKTVTVKGKGSFAGTVQKTYEITKAAGSIRYGISTVTKKTGDTSFINALTVTGDGAVTYSAGNPAVATVNGQTGEVTITGAGTTYIRATVRDGTNYTYSSKTASYTLKVNTIQASVITAPSAKKLTYNGDYQKLVSAGTASGGTMKYRLSGETEYSATIPVGVTAGEYTVYYKAEGDGPAGDSAEAYIIVTIEKAWPGLHLEIGNWVEGNTPSEPVLSGNYENGAVTYEYKPASAPDNKYSEEVPTTPGEYLIRASVEETKNYHAEEVEVRFSIYPANGSGENPGYDEPGPDPGHDTGDGSDAEQVTVSDNKPMDFYYESKGEYSIGYSHAVPFWGKAKPTAKLFNGIKVSFNGIDYTVSKVRINKKKCTMQILALSGADKAINKGIKKATSGSSVLGFTVNPYYVRNTDRVIPNIKNGILKSVKVVICGKAYKAKDGEFSYDPDSGTIIFIGKKLDGRYSI